MKSNTQLRLARVHILKKEVGMQDEEYRAFLKQGFGVTSSKELTQPQINALCGRLQSMIGTSAGHGPAGRPPLKFTDMDNRPGMASGKQLRMLDAMWSEVSRVSASKRAAALDAFIAGRFGVAGIRWVESGQVSKIARAIKAMKNQKAAPAATEAA